MKIIKNVTASNIFLNDVGVLVTANSYYILNHTEYDAFAQSNDIIIEVASLRIVVNDSENDLNISDGIDLIKGPYCRQGTSSSTVLAENVLFNPSGTPFTSTNLQTLPVEIYNIFDGRLVKSQAGRVNPVSFVGNPKKVTVTLYEAYADNNYSVTVSGRDGRSWSIENLTTTSFEINSQANQTITDTVFWKAQYIGTL